MSLKISVITPSYNSAEHIEHAIKNVLEQDYENFEHVIVDGASTDDTVAILKKYPHLKWVSEPDSGQPEALNKGFRFSTGDIIVSLNGDDYFLPRAFQAVVPYFEKGAKVVVGNIKVEKEIGESFINDPKIKHEEMLRHWELNAYPYNPVGYFYLREVLEGVGGFNEKNDDKQDLEFLLAASSMFKFTKIDRLLGVYRDYEDTKTQRRQRGKDYWTFENFTIIDKHLEKYSPEFVNQFNEDRKKGYAQMMKVQEWKRAQTERIDQIQESRPKPPAEQSVTRSSLKQTVASKIAALRTKLLANLFTNRS
jgi:glycosyltransferase involved in cell wall biosynthesis